MFLLADYTGLTVMVYTIEGEPLGQSVIEKHDKDKQEIELRGLSAAAIAADDLCSLLILASPTPHEYTGKALKAGTGLAFSMFQGREKEDRKQARYKVKFAGHIDKLFSDGRYYPLMNHIEVDLTNISRSGLRFSAQENTLHLGNKFSIHLKLEGEIKRFDVVVINAITNEDGKAEYGCQFAGRQGG